MNRTRVLVTGANGFVGSAVKRAFENAGALVTGIDVREAPGVVGVDLSDEGQVRRLFDDGGYDVVAHLAASAIGTSGLMTSADSDPTRAVNVNIGGTVTLLQMAKEGGVHRFIYASSTTVYGPARWYEPVDRITEKAALLPVTVYGATKVSAEHLGRCLTDRMGMDFVALRLPLVYGPQRWYGGTLAPLLEVLESVQKRKAATVTVGTEMGDWLHVEDAARAFVAVSEAEGLASAYHLVGHTGTMYDLASRILHTAPDHRVTLQFPDEEEGQAPPLISDTRAREDWNFSPSYPDARSAAASLLA